MEPALTTIAAAEPAPAADPAARPPTIRGVAYAFFVYDVGFTIRLPAAETALKDVQPRGFVKPGRRAPSSIELGAPPLRVAQVAEPVNLGAHATAPIIEASLYEFGSVAISFAIPLVGALDGLRDLSQRLYDNAALRAEARRRVEALLDSIRPAVVKPHLSPFVEDYTVFCLDAPALGMNPDELLRRHAADVAQILRAEAAPLSAQEVADALAARTSYGADDLTLVDWNAALVLDADADDVRLVLEYANVELLESRFLDQQLDHALEQAYDVLGRERGRFSIFRSVSAEMRKIARLQADSAMLFEGSNNALKLIGDQYLARVYRAASQRLHLPEWDAAILRKLETIESIYAKLDSQQAARRMEVLEWIIIALIAVSIVLPFVGGGK